MAAAKAAGIKVVDLRLADVSQPASDLIAGQTDGESDKTMQMGVAEALTKANGNAVDSLITSNENPPSKGMGDTVKSEMAELRRAVEELGLVGCNLDPDPSGGHWNGPPLTDRSWYPLYEAMVELDVPAMVHVSAVDNPNFHATGSHYLNADTTAFMQLLQGDLFVDFPELRLVVPHGGGAVPYHWGRFRGLADMLGRPPVEELMRNIWLDTCVYHQPGIDLLFEVVDTDHLLFGSEMVGAVRGIDPRTGHHFDDTRRYVDSLGLSPERAEAVYETNARRVFPRLDRLVSAGASVSTGR